MIFTENKCHLVTTLWCFVYFFGIIFHLFCQKACLYLMIFDSFYTKNTQYLVFRYILFIGNGNFCGLPLIRDYLNKAALTQFAKPEF
jgi:hypothetical protein